LPRKSKIGGPQGKQRTNPALVSLSKRINGYMRAYAKAHDLDLGDKLVRAKVRHAASLAVELDEACRLLREGNRRSRASSVATLLHAHQRAEKALQPPPPPKPVKAKPVPAPDAGSPAPTLAEYLAELAARKRAASGPPGESSADSLSADPS
jgi:hypothetical protein